MSSRLRSQVRERDLITDEQTEVIKHEVGRLALNLVEDYFPDETKARRRTLAKRAFVVGVVVGMLLRHAMTRNSGSSVAGSASDRTP